MSDCNVCGNHSWLCQQCKMEALEGRYDEDSQRRRPLETDDGRSVGSWIRVDGVWHASIEFDGYSHTFACDQTFEDFPAEQAAIDHATVDVEDVCQGCRERLEPETVPIEWRQTSEFARASSAQVRTDGGRR